MKKYEVLFSPAAAKDAKKLARSHLQNKCKELLDILAVNPYANPPPYEKLCGDLRGCFSRRINIQHRLIYEVDEKRRLVKVLRMWTHYE